MLASMGTELQYSRNFFVSLPRSHASPLTVTFETPDDRPSLRDVRRKEYPRPQPPMDGLGCVKDSLKKTMLEHEKIFRDQVRELHRVYRIQKLLMSQQRQGGLVGLFSSTQSNDKLSAESLPSCSDEECDLDLTLSIGLGGGKKKARSGSRSDTKFGCCPESSANSTGRRAAFAPARSDPGAAAGPLCRC